MLVDRQNLRVAYVCRMLGTPDHDRCNALSDNFASILAVNWKKNTGYQWNFGGHRKYTCSEIDAEAHGINSLWAFGKLVLTLRNFRPDVVLIYGYQDPHLFLLSVLFRLLGKRVFSINDSKYDDYSRRIFVDLVKVILLLPYSGYLAASKRSSAYLRYLGCRHIELYRCAIDTSRIQQLGQSAFEQAVFANRPIIVIARFVPKKNYDAVLTSYEAYASSLAAPRKLLIVGYGELEEDIRRRVQTSSILTKNVEIVGYESADNIPILLAQSLTLLLLSKEEQYGIVVTEALASGIPVIASPSCGASEIINSFENGFVIEPENLVGIAAALKVLSESQAVWDHYSRSARRTARLADVSVFVKALQRLLDT